MSTRSASSEIRLTFNATIQNALGTSAGAGVINATANHNAQILSGSITDGIDSGEANRAWWSVNRELGSGGNETLDLYQMTGLDIGAGSGNDALGQACLFEEIISIIVKHESGAGSLQIEPGAANPLNALGSLTVANGGALKEGGLVLHHQPGADGINLSSSTKTVKFTASGGAVVYSIYLLGRHDDDESSSTSSPSSSSSTSTSTSSASSSSTSSASSSSSS